MFSSSLDGRGRRNRGGSVATYRQIHSQTKSDGTPLCTDAGFLYDACIMNGINGLASRDDHVVAFAELFAVHQMMMPGPTLLR